MLHNGPISVKVPWWKLLPYGIMCPSINIYCSTVTMWPRRHTTHREVICATAPLLPPTALTGRWHLCYLCLKPPGDWGGQWPLDSKWQLMKVVEAVIDPPHKHLQGLVQVLDWQRFKSMKLLRCEPGLQSITDHHMPTVSSDKYNFGHVSGTMACENITVRFCFVSLFHFNKPYSVFSLVLTDRLQLVVHTEMISCIRVFTKRNNSKGYKMIWGGQAWICSI